MQKRLIKWVVVFLFLIGGLSPLTISASNTEKQNKFVANAHAFDLASKQGILIDLTDQKILYQKNQNEKIHPASMTKIMTVLVAVEHIKDFDETMKLGDYVFTNLLELDASVAGFVQGETVTMRDLLHGSMIPSGADASRALAIHISGSEENYVKLMNQKAKELGMDNTNYVNTSGLDEDEHYSTVSDIAKLLEYAIQNKKFLEIYKTREYVVPANDVRKEPLDLKSTLSKQIRDLGYQDNVIEGGKTGYTEGGGLCLASTANHDGTSYLAVTANGGIDRESGNNIKDAYQMYQYYFDHYERGTIVEKGKEYLRLPVKWNLSNANLVFTADQKIETLLPKKLEKSELKMRFIGEKEILTPVKEKQMLGQLEIMYGEELLASLEIRADSEIGRNPILYYGEPVIDFFMNNAIAMVLLIASVFIFIIYLVWRKKYQRYL